MIGINAGSGQLPYDNQQGWVNIDINPKWNPDIVGDWNDLSMFKDDTVDYVVAHHTLEHVGNGQADHFIQESYRVLKAGGSLLVFIPNLKALAQRWLLGQLSDELYMINIYGAFMDHESDRHKWGWTKQGLVEYLSRVPFRLVKPFDYRPIIGADCKRDWWITGMEATK